ncbi:MAG: hypothetical protein H7840_15635 [Alphaproteobacteria bacterium]
MILRMTAVVLALLVAGCSEYILIGPKEMKTSVVFSRRLEVIPDVAISVHPQRSFATIEGFDLDTLMVWPGIRDGHPLSPVMPDWPEGRTPPFKITMADTELVEFVETSLRGFLDVPVTTKDVRPTTLDGHPGIRFRYAYTLKDDKGGLDYEGIAVAATKKGRLYVIAYQGTRIYHFAKHLKAAEHVIATAKLSSGKGSEDTSDEDR